MYIRPESTSPHEQRGGAFADDKPSDVSPEIVAAARGGDGAAYRRITDATIRLVFRGLDVYYREFEGVVAPAEYEEIVTDAARDGIRRAIQSWDPAGGSSFVTWARWQGMNRARRMLATRAKGIEAETRYGRLVPMETALDTSVVRRLETLATVALVRQVLSALPRHQALLLVAAYGDGQHGRIAQLARTQGVSEEAVRREVRAARTAFMRAWRATTGDKPERDSA